MEGQSETDAVKKPFLHPAGVKPLIKTDRARIPVENDPFHASAAAPACLVKTKAEKSSSDAEVPVTRENKNIFEIERRQGAERGVRFEEDSISDRCVAEKGKVSVKPAAWSCGIADKAGAGGAIRSGKLFKISQCIDKREKDPAVRFFYCPYLE
jgi:hypothetical protein